MISSSGLDIGNIMYNKKYAEEFSNDFYVPNCPKEQNNFEKKEDINSLVEENNSGNINLQNDKKKDIFNFQETITNVIFDKNLNKKQEDEIYDEGEKENNMIKIEKEQKKKIIAKVYNPEKEVSKQISKISENYFDIVPGINRSLKKIKATKETDSIKEDFIEGIIPTLQYLQEKHNYFKLSIIEIYKLSRILASSFTIAINENINNKKFDIPFNKSYSNIIIDASS